jgi:hypothetical protein
LGDHTNKVKKGQKGENNVQVSRVVSTNYRIFCFFFPFTRIFFRLEEKGGTQSKNSENESDQDEDVFVAIKFGFFFCHRGFLKKRIIHLLHLSLIKSSFPNTHKGFFFFSGGVDGVHADAMQTNWAG